MSPLFEGLNGLTLNSVLLFLVFNWLGGFLKWIDWLGSRKAPAEARPGSGKESGSADAGSDGPDDGEASALATLTLIRGREILGVLQCPSAHTCELTIGRNADQCNQVVEDHTVSRCHAKLIWDSQVRRWYVEDLESRNGTRLNGRSLHPHVRMPMKNNSRLLLGRLELTVVTGKPLYHPDALVTRPTTTTFHNAPTSDKPQ